MRDSERQTERQRERRTDGQTEIRTDRKTETQKHRQTERQTDRKTDRFFLKKIFNICFYRRQLKVNVQRRIQDVQQEIKIIFVKKLKLPINQIFKYFMLFVNFILLRQRRVVLALKVWKWNDET